MTAVPLLDLKQQYEGLREEINDAVLRVIQSQQFILGPEVEAFESELAHYCGTRHALGVSSGTDAILVALMALDVGPGDEVIVPAYTFFATAGCVTRVGATPVFVDIEAATCNMDPHALANKITPNTRGIIAVHLYGQCADMDAINQVARQHGLFVIEDACQAIGSEFHGQRAGGLANVGCFSFFPSKNLGGFGDGGALTTNDTELDEKMRRLRMHGETSRYHHKLVGGNFRLDALQAAVLRVKLPHLDRWAIGRQRNAALYNRYFAEAGLVGPLHPLVETPTVVHGHHVFNQYVTRCVDRDALRQHLNSQQIGNNIYYPVPLHLQECFAHLGYRAGDMPESELAAATTLALPIYPELTPAQLRRVTDCFVGFYHSAGKLPQRRAA